MDWSFSSTGQIRPHPWHRFLWLDHSRPWAKWRTQPFSVTSRLPRQQWTHCELLSFTKCRSLQAISMKLCEAVGFRRLNRIRKLSRRETQCLQLLAMGRIASGRGMPGRAASVIYPISIREPRTTLGRGQACLHRHFGIRWTDWGVSARRSMLRNPGPSPVQALASAAVP